jgi:predicted DCC family thiol-disulfide oxidoreductase YuxK
MAAMDESGVQAGDSPRPAGWILYDDSCGFCRRWVPLWAGTLCRRGLEIAPLQSEWVAEKLKWGAGELTEDLRLLLSDGRHIQGADVYRSAMKRIWWTYPLYLISVLPLMKNAFDRGVRHICETPSSDLTSLQAPQAG